MRHLGDFDASTVVYGKFTTFRPSTGATFTLGGTPALSVYKDNSTTQSTTGVTLTVDFDSVTGLHHFAIDTSADGTFYSAGSFFSIVITTGTVDSVSVVGSVVAEFTIRKNSALKPTTAARTLDVSATGEAGIDWANIGSPTTAVNLSATNIDVDQVVASVSGAVGSVTGAVGSVTGNVGGNVVGSVASVSGAVGSVTGNVTGSVGSVATGGITRASFAADTGAQSVRSNTAQAGGATTITLDASASATDDFYNNDLIYITGGTGVGQARFITDYVGSTKVATVATWTTNPDNTSTFAILPGDTIPGATAPTAAQVADAVWDEALAGHAGAGSTGEALAAAGSAGDPWITALPGSYSSGQAGYILGTYLDAAVSTRASQTSLNTLDDYVDTEIAAIISAIATVDTVVNAILVDTDVTIPGLIATVDTVVDAILVDTGTDIPASIDALPTAIENADALLARDIGSGTGAGSLNERTVRSALRFLRNKWSISGTTLTVTKENDTDAAYTSTVSTDAAADPVVGSDPA